MEYRYIIYNNIVSMWMIQEGGLEMYKIMSDQTTLQGPNSFVPRNIVTNSQMRPGSVETYIFKFNF